IMFAAGTSSALAAPELVVRVDGAEVSTNFEQDFGAVGLGDTLSLVVVLRNEGNEDLVFSEDPPIQLSGGFPDQFEVVQPALETGDKLSPNSSTAFRIDFVPTLRFPNLSSNIYIFTNASTSPFHMQVRGQGVAPVMRVSQSGAEMIDGGDYSFPNTETGATAEREFIIENIGDADLVLTEVPPVSIVGGLGETVTTVTQQPDPIVAPGESTSFRVAFAPQQERPYSTRLFVYVNQVDADVNGIFDLNLFGDGVAAEQMDDPNEPAEPNEPIVDEPNEPVVDDPNQPPYADPNELVDDEPNNPTDQQGGDAGHDDDQTGGDEDIDDTQHDGDDATGDAENNDQNPIDDGDDAAAGGDDLENLE
ncbi:MAG: choice-of-anchor D domain-containing protein, partial [Planctomycetota bacterium]